VVTPVEIRFSPTHLDCLLGLYWTGLTLLNGFSFLVNFLFFYFGTCGRLNWLKGRVGHIFFFASFKLPLFNEYEMVFIIA